MGPAMTLRSPATRALAAMLMASAIVLGVLSGMEPVYAVALPIAALFTGLVFADLAVGVAVFTVTTFTEILPNVAGGVSFAKAVGLLLVLGWVAALVTTNRAERDLAAE